jgi:hypothetical protein
MKPKQIEQPKQKQYYTIKVEATAPILLEYRVFAEDEEEAIELMKKASPTSARPRLELKRLVKATVYSAGTSIIKMTKHFNGGR